MKEWARYIHDYDLIEEVSADIDKLREKTKGFIVLRHEKLAHQSKKDKIKRLTAMTRKIPYLDVVVNLMDKFVEGTIPYILYVQDSSEEVDLRRELLKTQER